MEILIDEVTEGQIEGEGAFDAMQQAFNAHLLNEYKKNRIKGTEYSQVYLGGMQAAMENAIAFVLGRQKADKEAELIASKILTEAKVRDKLDQEIELLKQTIEKMKFEIKEMEARVWVTKAQVSQNTGIQVPPSNIQTAGGVMGEQVNKLQAEQGLLRQKTTSELAQTNAGQARVQNNSVIGKEILIRQRQADGFHRDAEQKLAKIAGDSYNVQFTTLDGPGEGGSVPGHLTSGGVNSILSMAVNGVRNQ